MERFGTVTAVDGVSFTVEPGQEGGGEHLRCRGGRCSYGLDSNFDALVPAAYFVTRSDAE